MFTVELRLPSLILIRATPPLALFFFFNDPAPPEIYPLSLPDAFPILPRDPDHHRGYLDGVERRGGRLEVRSLPVHPAQPGVLRPSRVRSAADLACPVPPGDRRDEIGRAHV